MQEAGRGAGESFTIDVIITDNRLPTTVSMPAEAHGGVWAINIEHAEMVIKGDNSLAPGNLPGNFHDMPCPEIYVTIDQPVKSYTAKGTSNQIIGRLFATKVPSAAPSVWHYSTKHAAAGIDMALIPAIQQFSLGVTDYLDGAFPFYSPTNSPTDTYLFYNNIVGLTQPCTPLIIQLRFTRLSE